MARGTQNLDPASVPLTRLARAPMLCERTHQIREVSCCCEPFRA
jgi:hypothetical protein